MISLDESQTPNQEKLSSNKLHYLPIILISLAAISVFAYFTVLTVNQVLLKKASPQLTNSQTSEVKIVEKNKPITKAVIKSTSEIINENKKFIVMIMCNTDEGTMQGSGVAIGRDKKNDLLILTNYHMINGFVMGKMGQPPCVVMSDSMWNEYYYAQPIFYPEISQRDMELVDFALLVVKTDPKIEREVIAQNGTKESFDQTNFLATLDHFPTFCSSKEIDIGQEMIILGYPDISGVALPNVGSTAKFTATEGIVSSDNNQSGYYFNTSAKIDHGNSGGGAFIKSSNCLAGLPTFVVAGELESLGRVLKTYKLNEDFLSKILSKNVKFDFNRYLDEVEIETKQK